MKTIDKNSVILVTGGTGFLGTAVIRKLFEAGYTRCAAFGSKQFDLTQKTATRFLLQCTNPDVVIHLAAKVGGIGANQKNPATFAQDNLQMGLNLFEECHKAKVNKLIVAGTICAYPKMTEVPFKEEDLWNGYPEETNAPYGLAKKMLLVLAQAYRQQYGSNFVYVLPVNLFGPGDSFDLENSHVIPAMIRKFHEAKISSTKTVTLWGDGSPTREFLYVDDCAEAFVAALEKHNGPEPINIGSGKEISMKVLAEKIKQIVGYEGEIIWDTQRPNGQPRRCLRVDRAKQILGWSATTDLDSGLKTTYEWFKNFQK